MAKYLLDNGISIEPLDSLLDFFAPRKKGTVGVFQLLLDKVGYQDDARLVDALGAAIKNNDLEAARLLVLKGVGINNIPIRVRSLVFGTHYKRHHSGEE